MKSRSRSAERTTRVQASFGRRLNQFPGALADASLPAAERHATIELLSHVCLSFHCHGSSPRPNGTLAFYTATGERCCREGGPCSEADQTARRQTATSRERSSPAT